MTENTLTDIALDERVGELLDRPYRKLIRGDRVEGFLAEAPELPGCVTAGETQEEALTNLQEAMAIWLETALAEGADIPEPEAVPEEKYSGRMLLRMPQSLHALLARRARADGVSINQMAVTLLAQALGLPPRGGKDSLSGAQRRSRPRSKGGQAGGSRSRGLR